MPEFVARQPQPFSERGESMRSPSKSQERRFFNALKSIVNRLKIPMMDDLIHKASTGKITPKDTEKEAKRWISSFNFKKHVDKIVSRMVRDVQFDSSMSWRDAIRDTTNSIKLYGLIRQEMQGPVGRRVDQLVAENSKYISTVPKQWADYIVKYAYQEALKGKRPEEIEAELRKIMPEKITKNLKCIARTECAKANAAIVQSRAEMCGIKAYIWRSVTDERTRHAHGEMDGILVFYNDAPNPERLFPMKGQKPYGKYHAGNTFNCRCYHEPIVDMRFLPERMKVHMNGRIETMTAGQIKKKFGNIAG